MNDESTTPDLLELTRRMIEADTFDEWAMFAEQIYALNAVWETHAGTTLRGRGAIVAFVRDYWLMWDDHHHYVEENVDLGHGLIWGVVREHGRIKGSGAYVEARWALVSLLVEGQIVRATSYLDIDQARAAAERLAEDGGRRVAGSLSRLSYWKGDVRPVRLVLGLATG
jgi:ketosteroid isomerase-like protein